MTHKHSKHPEQALRAFSNRDLNTDDRTAELNRKPLVEDSEVPAYLNLDPEKVALGNLVAGLMLPTKEDVVEALEHREKRAARVKNATIYVFDEGESTGRHAAKDQPRYTVMGPHAVDQIAAEADQGYQPRHAERSSGYTGRHAGGRMATLLGKLRSIMNRNAQPNVTPEAPRYRAPIVQIGRGEYLPIGREQWVPGAGLDVISRDPEIQEHYERTGRHQGDFVVDRAGTFTYKDLGRNSSTLYYRERTPNEEEKVEQRWRIDRERRASMQRARAQLDAERAAYGTPPYPSHADIYVGHEIAASRLAEGPPTQHLTLDDQPTEQHRLTRTR